MSENKTFQIVTCGECGYTNKHAYEWHDCAAIIKEQRKKLAATIKKSLEKSFNP